MLSVIIPVYNAEKFLVKCVDSVVGQTYKDTEILLIDDGSKDNSPAMCDEYAQKYKNIRVFHKPNGGATSAYMLGIRECHGDFVTFVDSDDWLEPDMYESMMPYFEDNEINMVFCGYDKVSEKETEIIKFGIQSGVCDRTSLYSFFNKPNEEAVSVSRWNKIFRTQDIRELLPYLDEQIRFAEDNLFCLAFMIKFFKKGYFVDKIMYHYYFNDKSVSTNMNESKIDQLNKAHSKLLEIDDKKEYVKLINAMYIEFVFRIFRTVIPSNMKYSEKIKQMKYVLNSKNFADAKDNCVWNCYNAKQKLKKFLVKHKMARTYYLLNKLTNN